MADGALEDDGCDASANVADPLPDKVTNPRNPDGATNRATTMYVTEVALVGLPIDEKPALLVEATDNDARPLIPAVKSVGRRLFVGCVALNDVPALFLR